MVEVIVTFATPGGGSHEQAALVHNPLDTSDAIASGALGARRRGVQVANALKVMAGRVLVFDAVRDLGRKF
jgi:hypothetical protein